MLPDVVFEARGGVYAYSDSFSRQTNEDNQTGIVCNMRHEVCTLLKPDELWCDIDWFDGVLRLLKSVDDEAR